MLDDHHDASKIADFEYCPKSFDYKHNHGYRAKGDKIDLIFGQLLGEALEIFERRLFAGAAHEDAHNAALGHILANATNPDGTHKFGTFVNTWRCTGTKEYRNDKGNLAKCPYSHKGKYFVSPAPEQCSCGSPVEDHELWMPTKVNKDIDRLVEILVGYTDSALTRQLIPIEYKGKPLIEHYWEIPFEHPYLLKPVILCGNWDIVKRFGDEVFIVDYKSTGKSLTANYWMQFSPNVQVDIYNMAAKKVLPDLNIQGVAIEAFSTSSTENGFKLFRATPSQKAEMFTETAGWLGLLQRSAEMNFWPRRRTACYMCQFQPVCSQPPEARQAILNSKYERAKWNPQTRKLEPMTPEIIPEVNKTSSSEPTINTTCPPLKSDVTSECHAEPLSAVPNPSTLETHDPETHIDPPGFQPMTTTT